MKYYGKIKKYGNKIDLSSYGRDGFDWNYERQAGRKPEKNLLDLNFEDLYRKAANLKNSFSKKIRTFEETVICNENQYQDFYYVSRGDTQARCMTKMITITFKEDIQDKGKTYKECDRVLKSVERRIGKHFSVDRYKIRAIGVYERHKENRTGYHVHLIAFNIPRMEEYFYEDLKQYVKNKLRATIKIEAPKTKMKYDENNNVKVRCFHSMKEYMKKMFNYIKKQFRETINICDDEGRIKSPDLYTREEKREVRLYLLEILPDFIGGKTFIKRGRLKSPEVQKFQSSEEFEIYRDGVIKGGDYKVKDVHICNSFIPVTFVFLEKTLEKIRSSLNLNYLEFISRGVVGSQEEWYCWKKKIKYTALAGCILKEE